MIENTPFIGLLCMDRKDGMKKEICSYIDSKYVEYLVAGGAKVVPIWNNKDLEYYYDILNKVNGVLLPGGAVYVNEHDPSRLDLTNYYVRATEIIIRIAKEKFDKGIHLPIWGTCLGFQLLVLYTTETAATTYGTDPRDICQPMNCDLKVEFLSDFRDSRLFAHLPPELEIIMRNEPFGRHRHRYCWTIESCKSFNDWHILAKNTDGNGTQFASIMEHRRYPFYGSQFHPESDCLEHCLKVREYLAKFFVDDSGRSPNRFVNAERYEIQNFPKIAGKGNDQIYAFGESPDYPD